MKAVTMLEKLQMQPDAYDVTCLLLVDWRVDVALRVSNVNERIPASLQMSAFFKQMVNRALLCSTPDAHLVPEKNRIVAISCFDCIVYTLYIFMLYIIHLA